MTCSGTSRTDCVEIEDKLRMVRTEPQLGIIVWVTQPEIAPNRRKGVVSSILYLSYNAIVCAATPDRPRKGE
jgi:hypothetical protein